MTVPFMYNYTLACDQGLPPARRPRNGRDGGANPHPQRSRTQSSAALDKVRADKLREAKEGHDGTWVAHPGLVGIASEVFDEFMPAAESSRASARRCPMCPQPISTDG